jgi:hypothetical protein
LELVLTNAACCKLVRPFVYKQDPVQLDYFNIHILY